MNVHAQQNMLRTVYDVLIDFSLGGYFVQVASGVTHVTQ